MMGNIKARKVKAEPNKTRNMLKAAQSQRDKARPDNQTSRRKS